MGIQWLAEPSMFVYNTIQYNTRLLTIADMPQLSFKIYTIAIHTNILST